MLSPIRLPRVRLSAVRHIEGRVGGTDVAGLLVHRRVVLARFGRERFVTDHAKSQAVAGFCVRGLRSAGLEQRFDSVENNGNLRLYPSLRF